MALTTAFAENGDKLAIPETASDSSVSYNLGFTYAYALPPEEGGKFIDRAQFNQLMYDTTSAVISNQNSINTLNGKVTANQNSINTLNQKVADIESSVSTGVVSLTGDQAIAGVKTFSVPPVSATNPTNNNQVANKAYVDSIATALSSAGSKILTENLVKTVGARGADFANLRQALEWASQYSYSSGRFTITLNCNADMPIPGTYLPFGEVNIIIDGQNNTFNCNNSYYMTFAHAPTQRITIKNFTFNYNNITSTNYGSLIQSSDQKVILENITINVNNSTIGNLIVNQRGFLTTNSITLNCQGNTNISNVITGAYSTIVCPDLVVNVSQLNGKITNLFSFTSGQSNLAQDSSVTQALPTDKISKQIKINNGAIVACGDRFDNSKLSVAPNELTSAGIIFKS